MNQNYNEQESGRSMVEMLGVLAIIGVLSVGGITGYTTAMNKHKANEILDEVSKRAVVGAGQLLLNKGVNLAEFENTVKKTYPIGVAGTGDWTPMQNEFAITVQDVPDAIAQKVLQTGMPTATDISTTKSGDKNTITFAFNKDLTPGNAIARQLTCTGTKPEGATNTCVNGQWQCPNGQLECNGTCCPNGSLCISPGSDKGTCYTPADEASECATNADCTENPLYGEGYFCYLSDTTSASAATSNCAVAAKGECKEIAYYYKNNDAEESVGVSGPFTGWTYSKSNMDWWAANNWCLAQGKFLVTLDDVYKATGTSKASDATENDIRKTALAAMFGGTAYSIWTGTTYSSTSCYAYYVYSKGNVPSGYFRNGDSRAVCRG